MKPTNTKFLIIFHVYFAAYALFFSHFFEADEVFFLGMILGLSIFFLLTLSIITLVFYLRNIIHVRSWTALDYILILLNVLNLTLLFTTLS